MIVRFAGTLSPQEELESTDRVRRNEHDPVCSGRDSLHNTQFSWTALACAGTQHLGSFALIILCSAIVGFASTRDLEFAAAAFNLKMKQQDNVKQTRKT